MKLTESQVLFTAENHDNLPAQPGRSALELIKTGAPDTIRTCDLWIRNPLLYPAELRGHYLWDDTLNVDCFACGCQEYSFNKEG